MDLGELLKDLEISVKVSYFKITFAYQALISQGNQMLMLPTSIGHFDWYGKTNPYLKTNQEELDDKGRIHAADLVMTQVGSSFVKLSYFTLVGIIPVV